MLITIGGASFQTGFSSFSTLIADGNQSSFTINVPKGLTFLKINGFLTPGLAYAVGLQFNGDVGANYNWSSLDYAQIGNTFSDFDIVTGVLAAVPANGTAEYNFAIGSLIATDHVYVNKPSYQVGLGIVNARALAGSVSIEYMNNSAAPIVPASETLKLFKTPHTIPITKNDTSGDTSLHIGPALGGHSLLECNFTIPALTAGAHRTFNSINIEDAATQEKHDHYGVWLSNSEITSIRLFNILGINFNAGTVFELFGKT